MRANAVNSGAADDNATARSDLFAYMADLIAELESLTARERGCETLAGLLALARAEAERHAQSVR